MIVFSHSIWDLPTSQDEKWFSIEVWTFWALQFKTLDLSYVLGFSRPPFTESWLVKRAVTYHCRVDVEVQAVLSLSWHPVRGASLLALSENESLFSSRSLWYNPGWKKEGTLLLFPKWPPLTWGGEWALFLQVMVEVLTLHSVPLRLLQWQWNDIPLIITGGNQAPQNVFPDTQVSVI